MFAPPNGTARFCEAVGPTGAVVQMAPVLAGYPAHMAEMSPDRRFEPADLPEPPSDDVIRHLDQTGTEVLVNYLPVGRQQATEFFADCEFRAGWDFVNYMPVFIAHDHEWGS